jgi:DNA polymerase I-like protein with 3'-5' exonuclease and polymerase domains
MQPVTLDFETHAIEPWPNYPPKPVGLAVRWPDGRQEYLAWGHPKGNNASREQAERLLRSVWDVPVLFHNSSFDIAVAMKEFGLPYPRHVEDTMFQLFLHDADAPTLALKPSSERLLGMPPDEQNMLEQYIRSNIRNAKDWGAYIAQAPADVVAPYALGDVDRTFKLWEYLDERIKTSGMEAAYERELKLQPILMEATSRGIRTNVDLLAEHLPQYEASLNYCDEWVRRRLQSPNLNIDSNDELADALDAAGLAGTWPLTPTGRRSTSKEALKTAITCQDTLGALAYRGSIQTCLTMFMRPWLAQAGTTGRCHPSWNQVRNDEFGARTGRLSSSQPNFQNVPNEFEGIVVPEGCIQPPMMRNYLFPEEGCSWTKRDYSQQELRVLAHFEDGALLQAYRENPRMDVHEYASELILRYTGHEFNRKKTKIVSFTLVYGGGIPALSSKLRSSPGDAAFLKETYLSTFPDVRELMTDVKRRGRAGLPVRTTGGRLAFAEPSKNGRDQSYKLLNKLIQGSAADITKQSIINWHEHPDRRPEDLFLATVHDENNISAPTGDEARALRVLGEAMLAVPLDVPLLSEGFVGATWGEVASVQEPGASYT